MKLQLDINWKLALVSALLLPLLLALGFWQLSREQEKISVQALHDERRDQQALALEALFSPVPDDEALAYLPVQASGRYDNTRQFLLDNRMHESRPGYELITPLHTNAGVVMINRGWLPQGPSRQELPALPAVEQDVTIVGMVYVPPGRTLVLSDVQEQSAEQWPKVIQRVEIDEMAEMLGTELFPHTVRLQEGQPGALITDWPVVTGGPETHRGYAVQWFTMAAVLLLLFLYSSIKRRET